MKKIECIIMDWAGTAVDYGCFAPVAAFVESFKAIGAPVTAAETRAHMGLTKIEEVRALFAIDHVKADFRAKYGRDLEVLMPYADSLKSLSEWYIQLLAESLGKRLDKQGNVVNYGRTPIVAVGTTDMHAQTQEHQEGPKDKVVQFVSIANWKDDVVVPHMYDEYPKLAAFSGLPLSSILEAARSSNAEALIGDGRPNANYILPELTPYHLGEVMFMLCLSIAYEGEFANVDAFNQPGVEVYKKFLGGRLKKLQEG